MEVFIKAAAIGMVGSVLAVLIGKYSREQAVLLNLITVAVILGVFAALLRPVMELAQTLEETSGISGALITPVYKCLAISIIAQFAAGICKDAGQAAVAQSIQLVGAAGALYVASPLFLAVISLVEQLIGG